MVLPVDQGDLGRGVAQGFGQIQAAETTSQDNDVGVVTVDRFHLGGCARGRSGRDGSFCGRHAQTLATAHGHCKRDSSFCSSANDLKKVMATEVQGRSLTPSRGPL